MFVIADFEIEKLKYVNDVVELDKLRLKFVGLRNEARDRNDKQQFEQNYKVIKAIKDKINSIDDVLFKQCSDKLKVLVAENTKYEFGTKEKYEAHHRLQTYREAYQKRDWDKCLSI